MTTSDTVTQYYNNVLQRDPSASELTSWVALIDSNAVTAEQALEAIVQSTEAQTYAAQVIRFYQAALGRLPEPAGIDGWVDMLVAGTTTTTDLAVGFVLSPEWTARFGSTEVNQATLTGLYQNVLGRTPSGAEVQAWIDTGLSMDQVLVGFANSAEFQANVGGSVDALLTQAGTTATADLGNVFNPGNSLPITGDQEVTLTEGVDVLTANVFNAPRGFTPGGTDQVNTLDDDDVLTGTGDNPTLNLSFVQDADTGDQNIQPTMNGVETLNINVRTDNNAELDLQNSTGVQNINVTGLDDSVTFGVDNIQDAAGDGNGLNIGINNLGDDDSTLNFLFDDDAVEGTSDQVNVTLNDGDLSLLRIEEEDGEEGVETINLNVTGGSSSTDSFQAEDLQTLNVTGDENIRIGSTRQVTNNGVVEANVALAGFVNVAGSFSNYDGSGNTANQTVHFGTETTATQDNTSGVDVDFMVTGGSGDDTFRFVNGFDDGDTIDGGAGTNTIGVFASTAQGSVSNFQTLEVRDIATANNAITVDTSIFTGLESILVRNEGNSGGATPAPQAADSTFNLDDVSTTVANNGIDVLHSTSLNNGVTDTTVNIDLDDASGSSDSVTVDILDAQNADPRFSFVLNIDGEDAAGTEDAGAVENVTINDSDTESNGINLNTMAQHVGTLTLAGGEAGDFLNLDVIAGDAANDTGAARKDLSTTANPTDGVGFDEAGGAGANRFVGSTFDASGLASDVIARFDTLRDVAGTEQPGGGQTITGGSGNDLLIFDQIAGANTTTAGLTISDTVNGGDGTDTLGIDGNGTQITLGASEWTNVTNFENIQLFGNGNNGGVNTATAPGNNDAFGRNEYNLLLTNDLIANNGEDVAGGRRINIINDNDTANDTLGTADTAGTGTERGVTIDARGLNANSNFSYNGEEGATRTADRFIMSDANINGLAVIDGGAVLGGGNTASNLANADVLEIRNQSVVTVGDLDNVENVAIIEFTNDQAASQTNTLVLDNAVVDAMVNSTQSASAGNEETLTIRAFDNPLLAAAQTIVSVDATQVTNSALQLNVSGDTGADTITGGAGNDVIDGGGGVDTINLSAGGSDAVVFDAANAASTDGDLISSFTTGVVAGNDQMRIDVSDVAGGIVANLTASVVNVAGSANDSIIVDTANTGYANFAAAEAAVQAANAATTDYLLMFFNTTTNRVEVYADADSSAAGGEVLLASFTDITAAGAATTFMGNVVAGNFDLI